MTTTTNDPLAAHRLASDDAIVRYADAELWKYADATISVPELRPLVRAMYEDTLNWEFNAQESSNGEEPLPSVEELAGRVGRAFAILGGFDVPAATREP